MSNLRKLWNQISEEWKDLFIHKFSIPILKFSQWKTLFISEKFLENIYKTEVLDIHDFKIYDLSGLVLTPHLKKLQINKCSVESLDGIEILTQLQELNLSKNFIKNLYPLYFLNKLKFLDVSHNQISYLFPLFRSNLEVLYCSHNKIKSLDGLENIKNLQLIDASYNKLTELDFTDWKNSLQEIWISNNQIRYLKGLPLHSLQILDLSYNPILLENIPQNFKNELIIEGIEL